MGLVAIACYHPHYGNEKALLALVRQNSPLLLSLGLITERPAILMQAQDKTILEIFEWQSAEAKARAHATAEVMALWTRMMELGDNIPLSYLKEASDIFANFIQIQEDNTPAAITSQPDCLEEPARQQKDIHRFGTWAKTYDQSFLQGIIFGPIHKKVFTIIQSLPDSPQTFLDIGCGTGRFLRMIHEAKPSAVLYGIDLSVEMLAVAKAQAREYGIISFFHAPAESIPLPDASIDAAFSTMSFHHWSQQSKALSQIHDKLKPKSYFLLADIFAAGIMRPIFAPAHHGTFNTIRELTILFEEAGLTIVRDIPLKRYGATIRIIVAQKTD